MFPPSKHLALAAVVVLGMGAAIWVTRHLTHEPTIKGKSVGYWVDRACVDYESNESWASRLEVNEFGAAAVPRLVDYLRASERWRKRSSFRTRLLG